MSTANSNLDNDPFPVFTPRNLNTLQLQSRIQQQSQTQQQQQPVGLNIMQQSPFHTTSTTRFTSANPGLMRSPNTSTTSNNMQSQLQTRLIHSNLTNSPNFVLPNMVQNLTLNTSHSPLNNMQSVNKLQSINNTPPPSQPPPSSLQSTSSATSLQQQQLLNSVIVSSAPMSSSTTSMVNNMQPPPPPHAHRKLFPLDATTPSTLLNHQLTSTNNNNNNNNSNQANSNANNQIVSNANNTTNNNNNNTNVNMLADPSNMIEHQVHDYDLNSGRVAPPDLSHIYNLKRSEFYFMNDELRNEIIRKNVLTLSAANPEIAMTIPPQIKDYHNLVPLDSQQSNTEHKSRTFNSYQTISYKATHIKTNCVYFLKVILGFRFTNQRCIEIVEMWKKLQHANIITLRDVFGTKEFNGEHALVFVYDYYPGLETLQQRLYNNQNFNLKGWANPYNLDGSARPYSAALNGSRALGLLPEQVIWDYIIQLTSIIRTVHSLNLSCRILTTSRILIDHKSRLRLSGCGIFDVIDYEGSIKNIATNQQDDLTELGRLVLALSCNSLFSIQKEHINTSIDIISRNYSRDLRGFILHFLTPPNAMMNVIKNINDAMPMIGARFYTCLDNAYTRGDVIENELSKEVDNSRLFRLICKLNILLDRQDCGDIAWSETGDRYMLKLFRDYVFHQVNSNGTPWIDLSHIIQCLNKFDYGSTDKICLVSPDGQNIMIVTYAQLKKSYEKVLNELTSMMSI